MLFLGRAEADAGLLDSVATSTSTSWLDRARRRPTRSRRVDPSSNSGARPTPAPIMVRVQPRAPRPARRQPDRQRRQIRPAGRPRSSSKPPRRVLSPRPSPWRTSAPAIEPADLPRLFEPFYPLRAGLASSAGRGSGSVWRSCATDRRGPRRLGGRRERAGPSGSRFVTQASQVRILRRAYISQVERPFDDHPSQSRSKSRRKTLLNKGTRDASRYVGSLDKAEFIEHEPGQRPLGLP